MVDILQDDLKHSFIRINKHFLETYYLISNLTNA